MGCLLDLWWCWLLAWRCHTHNSSHNVSLRPLHWAVIMGRVSTEPGKKKNASSNNWIDLHESTHLSSPAAAMFVENGYNPSALWWRGWFRYCWSSVHHRIKPALTIWLVRTASVRGKFLPNGAMPDRTSRPKMLWAGLSSSGIRASWLQLSFWNSESDLQ